MSEFLPNLLLIQEAGNVNVPLSLTMWLVGKSTGSLSVLGQETLTFLSLTTAYQPEDWTTKKKIGRYLGRIEVGIVNVPPGPPMFSMTEILPNLLLVQGAGNANVPLY